MNGRLPSLANGRSLLCRPHFSKGLCLTSSNCFLLECPQYEAKRDACSCAVSVSSSGCLRSVWQSPGTYFSTASGRSPCAIARFPSSEERSFLVTATGTINPITTVQVGSQVSGMIESLHADFNSKVKANQVVARIDPFPYQARRDQAIASLANAKAALEKARIDLAQRRRELDRAKSLIGQQFISQNEVDVALTASEGAVAQLKVTEAAVKQAEAMLQAAELDLKYTVIRSPVDGVVISRLVEVGQRIAASFTIPMLFLIAEDVTKMQVDTNVSEADIGGIVDGKAASFTVDAYPGEAFQGRVHQVRNAPINIQNVVTYDVVVKFENPEFRLKPGMTANVSIVVNKRDDVLEGPERGSSLCSSKGG